MIKYIIRRIVLIFPVVLGITFLIFMVLALAPGDIAATLMGPEATLEQIAAKRSELGMDKNVLVRYFLYMKSVFQGDLGNSWLTGKPVILEFQQRLPNSLYLSFCSLLIITVFGLSFGVIAAIRQNKPIDGITLIFALLFASMPTFWIGLMMQLLFALKLGWLPSMGVGSIKHFIMPAFALSTAGLAVQIRMTRSSMLDVIKMDYIRTAMAKGASGTRVVFRHVIRNGLLPVVTNLGISFANSFGGTVITESVFSVPGIGSYMINAVKARDIPIVMGVIIFVAFIVAIINLIVDLIYAVIDPRVKLGYMS